MVETKEMAVIFEIKPLNDELEQLIPIKIVVGNHDSKSNTFKDNDSGIVYKHIESITNHNYGYAKRIVLGTISDDKLKALMNNQIIQHQMYRYIRYKEKPDMIFTSIPGEEMILLDDIDSIKKDRDVVVDSPKVLEDKVKTTVRGQDEAIKKIVTSLWMTINFPNMTKRNMLVIGPTGVGKTIIFKKLQKILGLPLTIFSVPGLSQAGYEGRSTDEILKQVYFDSGEDEDKANTSIVILDEIDKLAYGNGKTGDVSTTGVQNELLKIIEGVERTVEINNYGEYFDIDTSNMIFIGTGAFSELYEKEKPRIGFDSVSDKPDNKITTDKLVKYGLKRELLGRFPIIVELNAMTKEILKDIIMNSDESELKMTIQALESLGISMKNIDDVIDIIVEDAIKKEVGARGLVATINNIFLEIFYQVANNPNKYGEIIVGKNILEDKYDFQLVKKIVKKRTKKISRG